MLQVRSPLRVGACLLEVSARHRWDTQVQFSPGSSHAIKSLGFALSGSVMAGLSHTRKSSGLLILSCNKSFV